MPSTLLHPHVSEDSDFILQLALKDTEEPTTYYFCAVLTGLSLQQIIFGKQKMDLEM